MLDNFASSLQAGRAQGLATADPVRFAVIEALARRAAAQQGPARQLMLQRAAQLLDALASAAPASPAAMPAPGPALAGLAALVDRLGRAPGSPSHAATQVPAPAALKAVVAFKGTWSRLRAEQRLRQALDQVPAMAGPLNSWHVVSRALQALQALSPAYLDAFMAHVDTLLWLEQASGAGPLAARPQAAADSRKRGPARPARKA